MTKLLTAVLYVFAVLLLPGLMEGTEGSENDSLGKYRKSGIQAPEVSPNPYGRLLVYTWGIGGARVARPSNPSATPPNIVEIPSKFSSQYIIHISFSGH